MTFLLCDPGWYVQRTWCPERMGRKHTHTHTLSILKLHSPYSNWIWCLLTEFLPSSAATSIHLFKPPHAIGPVAVYRLTQLRTDSVHCRESAGTGPVNLKVVPTGAALTVHHEPNNMRLYFLHPLLVWRGHVDVSINTILVRIFYLFEETLLFLPPPRSRRYFNYNYG